MKTREELDQLAMQTIANFSLEHELSVQELADVCMQMLAIVILNGAYNPREAVDLFWEKMQKEIPGERKIN